MPNSRSKCKQVLKDAHDEAQQASVAKINAVHQQLEHEQKQCAAAEAALAREVAQGQAVCEQMARQMSSHRQHAAKAAAYGQWRRHCHITGEQRAAAQMLVVAFASARAFFSIRYKFSCWAQSASERRRMRCVSQKMVAHWRRRSLVRVLTCWIDHTTQAKWMRRMSVKALCRGRMAGIARAMVCWTGQWGCHQKLRRGSDTIALRWKYRALAIAVAAWWAQAQRQQRRYRALLLRMLERETSRVLGASFARWRDKVGALQTTTARAHSFAQRMIRAKLGLALLSWCESVAGAKCVKHVTGQVVRRWTQRMGAAAFELWQNRAKKARQMTVRASRLMACCMTRVSTKCLDAWNLHTAEKMRKRALAGKRLLCRTRHMALGALAQWTMSVHEARMVRRDTERGQMVRSSAALHETVGRLRNENEALKLALDAKTAEVDERERRLLAVATEVAARTADGEKRLAGRVEALGHLVHGLELMHTELSDGTQTLRAAWAHKESSMQAARVQVIQVQAEIRNVLVELQMNVVQVEGDLGNMQERMVDRTDHADKQHRAAVEHALLRTAISSWHRGINHRKHRRSVLKNILARMQRLVMSAALGAWRENAAELKSAQNKAVKATYRWTRQCLVSTVGAWAWLVREDRRKRLLMTRILPRLTKKTSSTAFEAWVEGWKERKRLRAKTLTVVRRWLNETLARALSSWHDCVVDKREMTQKMLRAARRLVNRAMVDWFERWLDQVAERRLNRIKEVKIYRRRVHRVLAASFCIWACCTATHNHHRQVLYGVMMRIQNSIAWHALGAWRDNVTELQHKGRVRSKILLMLSLLRHALLGWNQTVLRRHMLRYLLSMGVALLLRRVRARCLKSWREYAGTKAGRRRVCHRARESVLKLRREHILSQWCKMQMKADVQRARRELELTQADLTKARVALVSLEEERTSAARAAQAQVYATRCDVDAQWEEADTTLSMLVDQLDVSCMFLEQQLEDAQVRSQVMCLQCLALRTCETRVSGRLQECQEALSAAETARRDLARRLRATKDGDDREARMLASVEGAVERLGEMVVAVTREASVRAEQLCAHITYQRDVVARTLTTRELERERSRAGHEHLANCLSEKTRVVQIREQQLQHAWSTQALMAERYAAQRLALESAEDRVSRLLSSRMHPGHDTDGARPQDRAAPLVTCGESERQVVAQRSNSPKSLADPPASIFVSGKAVEVRYCKRCGAGTASSSWRAWSCAVCACVTPRAPEEIDPDRHVLAALKAEMIHRDMDFRAKEQTHHDAVARLEASVRELRDSLREAEAERALAQTQVAELQDALKREKTAVADVVQQLEANAANKLAVEQRLQAVEADREAAQATVAELSVRLSFTIGCEQQLARADADVRELWRRLKHLQAALDAEQAPLFAGTEGDASDEEGDAEDEACMKLSDALNVNRSLAAMGLLAVEGSAATVSSSVHSHTQTALHFAPRHTATAGSGVSHRRTASWPPPSARRFVRFKPTTGDLLLFHLHIDEEAHGEQKAYSTTAQPLVTDG